MSDFKRNLRKHLFFFGWNIQFRKALRERGIELRYLLVCNVISSNCILVQRLLCMKSIIESKALTANHCGAHFLTNLLT